MYNIPQSININGQEFPIRNKGDFRMVLDCLVALEDTELTKQERIVTSLIIFYDGMNSVEDLHKLGDLEKATLEMFKFFNCGQTESPGASVNYKLIDWERDSQLVSSAVNKVAGKEIRLENYVHWWTFMGYYLAVGESPLSMVVNIRNKIIKGKKLEKYETEFRRSNPSYFNWDSRTAEQAEMDEYVKQLWKRGE